MEEKNKNNNKEIENKKQLQINYRKRDEAWFIRTRNIIYYILGFIEVLLAFRLIFRSLGANAANSLVAALYLITRALITPFIGIFNIILPSGTNQYIIEPSTIIAMIVYAIIAVGIVRFIRVTSVSVDYR